MVLLSTAATAACTRSPDKADKPDKTGAAPTSDASASAAPPASSDRATSSTRPSASAPLPPTVGVPPVEARRSRITRLEGDPALASAVDVVKKHFGGQAPAAIDVQITDRPEGRGRALLVSDATQPASDPMAIVVDGAGALVWTKDRPAAGIVPPVGPLAIAAGPAGHIALAVCDPPTTRVALRLWDHDGSPFADYDAMDIDDCSALSLLYWPGRGYLVVASRAGVTRAQLVKESGALAWRRGLELGARTTTGAPASVAADTSDSFMLVQYGALSAEPRARPHALAFRYDVHGEPLWTSPSDLGEAPATRADDRIPLARPKSGVVRATLARALDIDVTSNGTVTKR